MFYGQSVQGRIIAQRQRPFPEAYGPADFAGVFGQQRQKPDARYVVVCVLVGGQDFGRFFRQAFFP